MCLTQVIIFLGIALFEGEAGLSIDDNYMYVCSEYGIVNQNYDNIISSA